MSLQLSLMFILISTSHHFQGYSEPSANDFNAQNTSHPFCHVNNFTASEEVFQHLECINVEHVSESFLSHRVEYGIPFVVSGVTKNWRANTRWTSDYFKEVFSDLELFSSTFATNVSPVFDSFVNEREIYYGIFLNDRRAADTLALDYTYPSFIPPHMRVQGMYMYVQDGREAG